MSTLGITPEVILAAQKKERSFFSRTKRLIKTVTSLGVFLLLVFAFAKFMVLLPGPDTRSNVSFGELFTPILTAIASYYISTLIHELGHVVAGKLVGFRFNFLIVGPIQLVKTQNGLKLLYSNAKKSQFAGMASASPVQEVNLRKRLIIFIVGGPTATIIQITFMILLRWCLRGHTVSLWVDSIIFSLLIFSLLLLLGSIIPRKIGSHATDIYRVLSLVRNTKSGEFFINLTKFAAASYQGVRPKHYNGILPQEWSSLTEDSNDILVVKLLAYTIALDKQQYPEALVCLNQCLDLLSRTPNLEYGPVIYLESAYFEAMHGDDVPAVQAWLKIGQKAINKVHWTGKKVLLYRTEAAVLLAKGDTQNASQKARIGLQLLAENQDIGQAASEEEWFDEIINLCGSSDNVIKPLPSNKLAVFSNVWAILRSIIVTILFVGLIFIVGGAIAIFTSDNRYQIIGAIYTARGDYDLALEAYETGIISGNGKNPNLYNGRGEINVMNGLHKDAIADFSKAINIRPDKYEFYWNRGNAYFELAEYNLAIADFSESLQLDPKQDDRAFILYDRGSTYVMDDLYKEAIADLSEAINIRPDSSKFYWTRGFTYVELAEYDLAIADFSESLRLNPKQDDRTFILFGRAKSYVMNGLYEEAIADFSEAINIRPDRYEFYWNRGASYFELGEYNLAIADLSESLLNNPEQEDRIRILFIRASAYSYTDEYDLAAADYRLLLEIAEEPEDREKAREYLKLVDGSANDS